MRNGLLFIFAVLFSICSCIRKELHTHVGLYRTFELPVENTKAYLNKFTDVELRSTFTAPSGKETKFWGFFDGDGRGGGDKQIV